MHVCAIIYNLWCLADNNEKIQTFMILLFFLNTNIFRLTKRANTNTNIFGFVNKGWQKKKQIQIFVLVFENMNMNMNIRHTLDGIVSVEC